MLAEHSKLAVNGYNVQIEDIWHVVVASDQHQAIGSAVGQLASAPTKMMKTKKIDIGGFRFTSIALSMIMHEAAGMDPMAVGALLHY